MKRLDQVNQWVQRATHLRDQLHTLAREFAQLHNEPLGSDEADELMHVILDGEDYEVAMERVLDIKKFKR